MGRTGFILFCLCILSGSFCSNSNHVSDSRRTRSANIITRKHNSQSAVEENETEFEEKLKTLFEKFNPSNPASRSNITSDSVKSRMFLNPTNPTQTTAELLKAIVATIIQGTELETQYDFLKNTFAIYTPFITQDSWDRLPGALLCILQDKKDCGIISSFVRRFSGQIGGSLQDMSDALKRQACSTTSANMNIFGRSAVTSLGASLSPSARTSLQTVTARIPDLQVQVASFLDLLPQVLSQRLQVAWQVFLRVVFPAFDRYIGDKLIKLILTPADFIMRELQMLVGVPSLDQNEQCSQGDLKQLILWGMSHNMSWSFDETILDMYLSSLLCIYPTPECRNIHFSRSLMPDTSTVFEGCDQYNFTAFNETLCTKLPQNRLNSTVLRSVCSAMDSLTASQVLRVASNGCARANQVSSFFQAQLESYASPCEPRSKVTRSVSESQLSLSDLVCLYDIWTNSDSVDPASVALCSENDQESFVLAVCYNGKLLDILIKDNDWLFAYCSNFSDAFTIVSVYNWCTYSSWVSDQIDVTLVAFCWNNDRAQFEKLLCEDLGLFLQIMSNPENNWIVANCTPAEEPIDIAIVDNVDQWCRYNEWQDPAAIDVSIISICVSYDTNNFTRTVCTNSTVLDKLLKNQVNSWLNDFCSSSSSVFSSASFCQYGQWAETVVDPSIVALCWDQDQLSFSKNVCCNMDLLEKMTQDPQNEWLLTVCRGNSSETANETKEVLELVCRYSEWTDPAGIDMTDIAVCSEFDTVNFTRAVCTNKTFLLQLIKNLDNTWLLQFCANHSSSGHAMNFNPQVICRYETWAVQIPDPTLVAVCWDYDQGNFVMLVCKNKLQLSTMSQDPTNSWVRSLCSSYNEITNHTDNNASYPQACIVRDIIRQLNWSCSIDYSAVCQQDSFQLKSLHHLIQCGMESVGLGVNSVLVEQVSSALRKAANNIVALLVTLEESKLVSLQVTENIRLSVLKSVMDYLKHEESFTNKRELLQCFGNLLMNLMQTGREVSDGNFFLIKEYFQLPIKDLKPILMPVEIKAGRQILQYLNRNWAALKLSDRYLQTMASVFFQKYMSIDSTIFLEFGQLLPYFSVLEISSLPGLQNNKAALVSINQIFHKLTLDQRREFGKWFGSSTQFLNVTQWPMSAIQDAGSLLAYLPFEKFKTLSAAQMFFGLDILLNNTLTGLQRRFIAQSILKTYHNLTAPDFRRLGNLTCLANTADLLVYKQTPALDAIKLNIQDCVRLGSVVPSEMVSSLLVERAVLAEPTSLSTEQLYHLAVIMPSLGIPFINQLLPSQVQAALPALSSVDFSPAQARELVDKLFQSRGVLPEMLASLGTLISGVKAETLRVLPTDTLLTALPNITLQRSRLSPAQHTAITTKLWGSNQVTGWLGALDPLLPETPLLSVRSRLTPLLSNLSTVSHRAWNTQQAKLLFRESLKTFSDIREDGFLSLGMISQGVDCETLKRRFLSSSSSVISRILLFLHGLPAQLHSSLKKCITNESYNFSFSAGLLEEMGAQVAVELPVSIIKRFPADMMETFRRIIVNSPEYFLRLPSIKQSLLVDKVVQRLGMSDGMFTGEEFHSLGVMAAFVVDEIFINISRFFFVENIERIRNYCFYKNKKDVLAMMLQEKATFGPVSNWTSETLDQVDRFIFFLPTTAMKQINKSLMTVERMERLFQSQRQWEKSAFGAICQQNRDMAEVDGMFANQQFMLQYFLGVLGIGVLPKLALVPSCSNVRAVLPSAWAVDSLTSMAADHFSNCLEAIGQDPNFHPGELSLLLGKVKQIYGPASALTPKVIQQLGRIATQFTSDELQKLKLNDLAAVTALGRIKTWTSRQLSVLYAAVLNSTKLTGSDLDASTLVALGYGICGIKVSEIPAMNPVEFSKSVRWVGLLRLDCTEEQLGALAKLLTHSLAFGPVSSWGSEVFIEIGGIAAGLEDFVLSSLAKEQIEGLTPLAISIIPPQKFSVVFSQDHIRMFSYEQGAALTSSQLKSLNSLQQTALSMVLTSWEDKPVDFRGRSAGIPLRPIPFEVLSSLLLVSLFTH